MAADSDIIARILPIEEFKDDILEAVEENQVAFIQGETGCGKSSLVPQFLYRANPENRIIVTQPRRFAAVSLRNRVADQLGDDELVGYRLGHRERKETERTQIVFCTTGYLLQYLSYNPERLGKWSHVILDEVHERTMDSDLLLLLMRLLLRQHPNVKLIVMSATLQPDLFVRYFSMFKSTRTPLTVGKQRFPVTRVYLDHLDRIEGLSTVDLPFYQDALQSEEFRSETANFSKPMQHVLVHLLYRICKPNTCYLVFLPGMGEIEDVIMELRRLPPKIPADILPLHSLLPTEEQDKVMRPIAPGSCKIVLSTNIAESSVTIPDAHVVIDSGLRRGIFTDERTGKPALQCRWISRASALQRAGRTGRVAPGLAVHLYPLPFYRRALREYDEPEMQHATLEKTVLTTRILLKNYGTVSQVLSRAMTPPSPERIEATITSLYEAGALAVNNERADVTALGKLAVILPLDLSMVRMVLLGTAMGRLPEAIVMAACQEQVDLFIAPSRLFITDIGKYADNVAAVFTDRVRLDGGVQSEPMTNLALYRAWLERRQTSISVRRAKMVDLVVAETCRLMLENRIVTLSESAAARTQLLQQLARGIGRRPNTTRDVFAPLDRNLLYFLLTSSVPYFLIGKRAEWDIVTDVANHLGMDPRRCVLISGVPPDIAAPSQLTALLRHPACTAVRAALMPGAQRADWIVELETGPSQPSSPTGVQDLALCCKVLHQFFLMNRNRLLVSGKGQDIGSELEIQGLYFPNELQWFLPVYNGRDHDEMVITRLNPRSPLRTTGDMLSIQENWQNPVAHAMSIVDLPTEITAEVSAAGVTILPQGLYGRVLQLVLARKVRRMRLRPLPPQTPEKDITYTREIVVAEVDNPRAPKGMQRCVHINFWPYYLVQEDLIRLNHIRSLVSQVIMAELPDDVVLVEAIRGLVREVQERKPFDEGMREEVMEWPWVTVYRATSPAHLPAFALKKQMGVLTEGQESRLRRRTLKNLDRERDWKELRRMVRNFFVADNHRPSTGTPKGMNKLKLKNRYKLAGFKGPWQIMECLPDMCRVEQRGITKWIIPIPEVPQATEEDRILYQTSPNTWQLKHRQIYQAFRKVISQATQTFKPGLNIWQFSLMSTIIDPGEMQLRFRIRFGTLLDLFRSMPDIVYLEGDPFFQEPDPKAPFKEPNTYFVSVHPVAAFQHLPRVQHLQQKFSVYAEIARETPTPEMVQRRQQQLLAAQRAGGDIGDIPADGEGEGDLRDLVKEEFEGDVPSEDDIDERAVDSAAVDDDDDEGDTEAEAPARPRVGTALQCRCACHRATRPTEAAGPQPRQSPAWAPHAGVPRGAGSVATASQCVVS